MDAEKIARAMREQRTLLENFELQAEALGGFADRIVDSFHNGGRLLLLGSGPLGTIANLIATRFLHRLSLERPPLPVLSLCHDLVLSTALERDNQGRQFFGRQLQIIATRNDIVFALADFQRDDTLAEALTCARQIGCLTGILLPGREGAASEPSDFLFRLDTDSIPRAVEGALLFGHLLCELVEGELFGV